MFYNDHAIICTQCQKPFSEAKAELHSTEDGVFCPHCNATNLFNQTITGGWLTDQEAMLDRLWESHHEID